MLPLAVLYAADGNCHAYCNGQYYIINKLILDTDGSRTSLGFSWAVVGLVQLFGLDGSKLLARI